MVLVSLTWYLDQQIKAAEGKWQVKLDFPLRQIQWCRIFKNPDVFWPQGSDTVRPMRLPEELKFTVDDRVRRDISLAKKQYLESVS